MDAITDAEATPTIEQLVEAVHAEGEAAFQRKSITSRISAGPSAIADVDQQVLSQVMLR